jgi:hypothetical protein
MIDDIDDSAWERHCAPHWAHRERRIKAIADHQIRMYVRTHDIAHYRRFRAIVDRVYDRMGRYVRTAIRANG